jgi:hypothetical protein
MSFLGAGGELIIDVAAKFGLNVGGSAQADDLALAGALHGRRCRRSVA